jgi:hypothetical protein
MEEREGRPVDWKQLVGGIVVGWILSWAALTLAVIVSLGFATDSDSPAIAVLIWGALFAPAVVLGVVLLIRRSRGQVVAGTLMGLTIGSVVGAGVCSATSLSGML